MDNNKVGTPKFLEDAIQLAIMAGTLSGLHERTYWAVRDFLAQRFGAEVLSATSEEDGKRLMELFQNIIERKP